MNKNIFYFKEKDGAHSAYRFVKSYRKRGFLRRERIEYTLDIKQALDVSGIEQHLIYKRLFKDYPDAIGGIIEAELFQSIRSKNRFWVITRRNEDGEPVEFYSGKDKKGNPEFVDDINEASIGLDFKSEADTAGRLRASGRPIAIDCIYLTLVNDLLNDNFMLVCTSKKDGERIRFFARQEDTRLRLVETSGAAKKMPYRTAIETYERLKSSNKNFEYAVLPAFKDNVSYKNLKDYIQKNNVSRALIMNLRLSKLTIKK